MAFKFELNEAVKDKCTGFLGTVHARCEYSNGDNRYGVEALSSTGALLESWFNEDRLEATGAK